jgi:hypothetical protein
MRRHPRPGFTLPRLLVVLGVLALPLGLLPTALVRARAEQERANTFNNLKMLALALHNHNDAVGHLPPGVDDHHFSATAYLLPYVEENELFKKVDFKKDVEDEANAQARKTVVKRFLSPRDPLEKGPAGNGPTNYLFNDKVFSLNSKARIPASFPDGTSNTVVIGETLKGDGGTKGEDVRRQHIRLDKEALKAIVDEEIAKDWKDGRHIAGDRCGTWMDGRFLQGTFNGQWKLNDPRPDVDCGGVGGASTLRSLDDKIPIALADGSARTVSAKKLSETTWHNALDPADGQPLGSDW